MKRRLRYQQLCHCFFKKECSLASRSKRRRSTQSTRRRGCCCAARSRGWGSTSMPVVCRLRASDTCCLSATAQLSSQGLRGFLFSLACSLCFARQWMSFLWRLKQPEGCHGSCSVCGSLAARLYGGRSHNSRASSLIGF
jgi:hypothetical protein